MIVGPPGFTHLTHKLPKINLKTNLFANFQVKQITSWSVKSWCGKSALVNSSHTSHAHENTELFMLWSSSTNASGANHRTGTIALWYKVYSKK